SSPYYNSKAPESLVYLRPSLAFFTSSSFFFLYLSSPTFVTAAPFPVISSSVVSFRVLPSAAFFLAIACSHCFPYLKQARLPFLQGSLGNGMSVRISAHVLLSVGAGAATVSAARGRRRRERVVMRMVVRYGEVAGLDTASGCVVCD
ncbi:hypothetical protein P167DRAFT_421369, partial [Morchella conica CCBAS932]